MFHGSRPFAEIASDAAHFGSIDTDGTTGMDWGMDARPSLLIIGGTEGPQTGTQGEMEAMAAGAGFRLTGAVTLDDMAERLARTVGVDSLLIDLRDSPHDDARMTALLTTLLAWPGWTDTLPLLLVDLPAVETVAALLHIRLDRLLCDPGLSDIGAGLCLLARERRLRAEAGFHLSDIGRETDGGRLEQLSAEVRRLAQTIDRLAREDQGESSRSLRDRAPAYTPPPASAGEVHDGTDGATREEVRTLLQARRMRDRFLPGELFADPAWDMMLDLLSARLDRKRVSVSSLCIASAVPPTTALRWIAQLTERGLFERHNDPDDARRVFITLSDAASEKLIAWFAAARRSGLRFAS
ncbi:MAG TPA: MarR family winged helix-turn-helix transcriptional regulator [Sphingobium sp.]